MNWTRKKSALTRVFPVSWFSRSKQKGGNLDSNSMKNKQKCSSEFPTPKSSGWREGRFYSMDEDDAYWRISFGEERIQGRRSTGGINPLWYDSDHEFKIPVPGFQSFGLTEMEVPRRDEYRNFSEMVSDIKRMKERRGRQRTMAENGGFRDKTGGTGEAGLSTQRRKHVNDQVSRIGLDDRGEKISDPGERDIFPVEPENMVQKRDDSWKSAVSNSRKQRKNPNIGIRSVKEDHEIANPERVSVSEWQNLKLKEIKIKREPEKKLSRKLKENSRGMKTYSPRTECKIRALEEMKKARMKSKKKERKEQVSEKNSIFDSFAVVKSSYDPQQDFRDSMVEMIREKGIGHPEELEELLACYLTLNCDEYHDLIIQVFRQVWFELKGMYIDPPIQNGPYFDR